MHSRTFLTIVIILTSFATISATDLFLPSLPSLTTYFGATEEQIQLSLPIYLIGGLICSPILGFLSDHYGSKSILILGLGIFLLGTILCIYSPTYTLFLSGRFIQGAGSVITPVVGWALLQDIYNGDESAKILSLLGSVIALSIILAPGIGGYVHNLFGWKANFIGLFILATLSIFFYSVIKFDIKKTRLEGQLSLKGLFNVYGLILRNKTFLTYISLYCFLSIGEWTYLTIIPFYFENTLNLQPDVFGLYLTSAAFFIICGTLSTPLLLKWFNFTKTIYIGLSASFIGGALLLFASLFASSLILLIIISIGMYLLGRAIIWAPTTSKALQLYEDKRASASAVRVLLLMASFAVGGFLGSALDDTSLLPVSICFLTMVFTCLILHKRILSHL